jgi:hypothetical protein
VTNAVPDTCPKVPNGVQEVKYSANISLYPNPASGILNIQSSQFIANISISDQMGRIVAQVSDLHDMSYQMNTSRLSSGVYIIRIDNGQGQVPAVKKVTIE